MRSVLRFIGKVLSICAWPALWVYYRVLPGRTRVVLVHGGKILVVKQWIGNGLWGLPGGGLHKGEDVVEGAVREVAEETGVALKPDRLWPLGSAVQRQRGLEYEYHMFAATVSSSKVRAQWYEVSDLAWMRPEELNPTNASPDVLHTLRVVRKKTSLL